MLSHFFDFSFALPPWGDINSLGQDHCFRTPMSILLYVHHSSWWYFFLLQVGAKTFCTKTKDNTVNPIWNEVFEVKILMGLWFLVHTSNMGYFISDCFVSDCLCEGLCGQLTWSKNIDWCLWWRQSVWWWISWNVQ